MKLTFSEWLALELEKPPTNPDYDPDGNSSRAIMTRVVDKGWLSHIWWAMCVYAGIWQDIKSNWNGCPVCAGTFKRTSAERILQINALPNIRFVKWASEYANNTSKAVCRCLLHGGEWTSRVHHLLIGRGCPKCAGSGYDRTKPATLYALRSECGTMVKIGISNDYKRRFIKLKRTTPFQWGCIALMHGCGVAVESAEEELHAMTERVDFDTKFDGFTEWRKWDSKLPLLLEHFRKKIEAP